MLVSEALDARQGPKSSDLTKLFSLCVALDRRAKLATMPNLSFYLDETDRIELFEWLNREPDIAWLVPDGPRRWVARAHIEEVPLAATLWHTRVNPIPLIKKDMPDGFVADPWAGWVEHFTARDPTIPNLGPEFVGAFRLRTARRPEANEIDSWSIGWIGDHYKIIGFPAHDETKRWWARLRRKVTKSGKVHYLGRPEMHKIWAMPSAHAKITAGEAKEVNLRLIYDLD